MTDQKSDREIFLRMLIYAAGKCNHSLDEHDFERYESSLKGFGYREAAYVLHHFTQNMTPSSKMPSPEYFISRLNEEVELTEKSQAMMIMQNILRAFRRGGYTYPTLSNYEPYEDFPQHFKANYSEDAWNTMQAMGGYSSLYTDWNASDNRDTFAAHLRDFAAAFVEKKGKEKSHGIALPSAQEAKQLFGARPELKGLIERVTRK
jgi:hypothetical protein